MHLHLTRDIFTDTATLGRLDVDGKTFGYVCEDTDRGLDASMPLADIKARKVKGRTAIPAGTYKLGLHASPSHGGRQMLHLLDVPGFQFILIHAGNSNADTEGCQLPGLSRDPERMTVARSAPAVAWLEAQIVPLLHQGAEVTYTIGRG